MANGDTKTQSYLRAAAEGSRADLPTDTCCNTKTQDLILGVAERIMDVEDEVERLENNPDVVDIVATYQDLQSYDTSGLTDKDIIRVLEDSTHSNNSTYYRWNANTNQFDFVGEIGGGSSVNVVQTSGTSTTDVMSQNATTSMVFQDPGTNKKIQIGDTSNSAGIESVAVGAYSYANNWGTAIGTSSRAGGESIGVGRGATASSIYSVAIGAGAKVENIDHSVAIGARARATRKGEVNVGTGSETWGYNNTSYRVIGGVHDGIDAHDATTVGQVNTRLGGLTLLPITQTDYDALTTKDPNTLYVITEA